ncbi:hypothetical protein SCHPADRAFT_597720 [Schizopora paradoxa]|uniref:Uncharacterized protein n=1 Tax=Schizopora paradoxa TaxID=27342 RepID=A0A0H2RVA2_9AGAM|nr:hypothetical protein SCHPADRAFT_597720 [Schizopora paradoxa]
MFSDSKQLLATHTRTGYSARFSEFTTEIMTSRSGLTARWRIVVFVFQLFIGLIDHKWDAEVDHRYLSISKHMFETGYYDGPFELPIRRVLQEESTQFLASSDFFDLKLRVKVVQRK